MIDSNDFPEFPPDFFPGDLEQFRQQAAASTGSPPELLVGPMLAAASAAIGTALVAQPKPEWREYLSLFIATVGCKAAGKTPAFRAALAPLRERQAAFVSRMAATSRGGVGDEIATAPTDALDALEDGTMATKPRRNARLAFPDTIRPRHGDDLILSDTTLPALDDRMHENPRGVLLYVDEMGGLLKSMSDSQRQTFCDFYSCEGRVVARRSRGKAPLFIPNTFVTLAGGLQPDFLPDLQGTLDAGLAERFLISGTLDSSLPPWSDVSIDPEIRTRWNLAIIALLDVDRSAGYDAPETQGIVRFTPEALQRLHQHYEKLRAWAERTGLPPEQRGAVKKFKGHVVRLATIRHALRWATGEFGFFGPIGRVDLDDCDAACRAAEFFLGRHLTWLPLRRSSATATLLRASTAAGSPVQPQPDLIETIVAYLRKRGPCRITVRQLQQATLRGSPKAMDIRAALKEAAAQGLGTFDEALDEFVLA